MLLYIWVAIKLIGDLCIRISTHARSTVILGVESKCVRVGFRHAEGLVTISRRVVADVDLVEGRSAGVVFDDTEVVVDIAGIGVSSELLELCCAGHFSFLLADQAVRIDKATIVGFWWAGIDTWKFKGVLDDFTVLAGFAAHGYFSRITVSEVNWVACVTFHYPHIHDGNFNIMHAGCHQCEGVVCWKIRLFETL